MSGPSIFVCTDDRMLEFPDVTTAVDAARDLAAAHARVGIDVDPSGARRACARALPGMVCCPRTDALGGLECYPLTATMALVTRSRRATAARPARRLHGSCVQ